MSRAQTEGAIYIARTRSGAEDHDRYRAEALIRLHFGQNLPTIHLGHIQVQKHNIGAFGSGRECRRSEIFQRLFSIGNTTHRNRKARRVQRRTEYLRHSVFIFHVQQNAHCYYIEADSPLPSLRNLTCQSPP